MKVIVPMAGTGDRFVNAGYTDPKPLIRLYDGRRIIEHVLDMFEPDDQFVFICNEKHLDTTPMQEILLTLSPSAAIVSIPCHKKGPVWTCMPALQFVDDDEPVIVSYCDGTFGRIDWTDFRAKAAGRDGMLFTHSGYHPHILSTTKLASVKLEGDRVVEVKEKSGYMDDPMDDHCSSGIYHFGSGRTMRRSFEETLRQNVNYNGEYYVTLAYNPLIAEGADIGYYDTEFMAILGTPNEVQNFNHHCSAVMSGQPTTDDKAYAYWSRYIARNRRK